MFLVKAVTRPKTQTNGKLEFQRYGNTYFLSTIWLPGQSNGRELWETAAEKKLARQSTQPGILRSGTVAVAAK